MKRTTPKAIAAIEPGCDRLERVLALALSELLMGLAAGVASNRLNPFLPAVGEFVGIVRTVGVRFEIVGTASVVGVLMNRRRILPTAISIPVLAVQQSSSTRDW